MKLEFIEIKTIDDVKRVVKHYQRLGYSFTDVFKSEKDYHLIKAVCVDNVKKRVSSTNGTCMARFKDFGGKYTVIKDD